jgi:hypothetical protein
MEVIRSAGTHRNEPEGSTPMAKIQRKSYEDEAEHQKAVLRESLNEVSHPHAIYKRSSAFRIIILNVLHLLNALKPELILKIFFYR